MADARAYPKIGEHGLIGDLHTAALVGLVVAVRGAMELRTCTT